MAEQTKVEKLKPKSTKHLTKILDARKKTKEKEEKPLYKMKMFKDVGSKVTSNLKNFKTYSNKKDNLDNLIEKVENELQEMNAKYEWLI